MQFVSDHGGGHGGDGSRTHLFHGSSNANDVRVSLEEGWHLLLEGVMNAALVLEDAGEGCQ